METGRRASRKAQAFSERHQVCEFGAFVGSSLGSGAYIGRLFFMDVRTAGDSNYHEDVLVHGGSVIEGVHEATLIDKIY